MLRWLTRLFRQREAVEAASPAPPASSAPPPATVDLTPGNISASVETVEAPGRETAATDGEPEKETCPTCGRTSVFAGPPGQRFCTYCALRDELFEASAAASE